MLQLDQGSGVADFLGRDPWGDLDAYRREVFDPMQPGDATVAADARQRTRVEIPIHDLPRINSVLGEFYDGYSAGAWWSGIGVPERAIFERLVAQVRG